MEFPEIPRDRVLLVLLLAAGLLIGSGATYLWSNTGDISQQQAGRLVVDTLQRQSGQQYGLVAVNTVSDLYQVDVRGPNDQLSTYYVTKDGRLFTSSMNSMSRTRAVISARESFSQCLANRSVVLYGNVSQRATQLQIQVLGGQQFAAPIYRDVSQQGVLQQAVQRGVTRVPSFYFNGSVLPGVNRLAQVQQFTGCQFSANASR